jgi:large subunit ribosomal protein L21
MYAIIETGGKQLKVMEGETVFVEKIKAEVDDIVTFDKVLAISDDEEMKFGTPILKDASVTAKVIAHGKDKKIIVFKMKPKRGYRRKQGHRQPHTRILIEKINVSAAKPANTKSQSSKTTDKKAEQAEKPVEKKATEAKKPAVKKTEEAKKPATSTAAKKPAAKKPATSTAAKKPAAKKPATSTAAKKPAAKKPAVKKPATKPVAKKLMKNNQV